MALTAKDLTAMKLPALALAIALAGSFAMVRFTSSQLVEAQARYHAELSALADARSRYQRSGQERETVLHYLQAYRELEKVGFVGAERRLNWVEGIRAANARAGLFGVDYQMSAQEPFPVAQDNPVGQRVKRSQMTLSFGVLHEVELMRLLHALSAQRAGLYALTECSLDRAGRQGAPLPRQPNLTAQCELSWLTVEPEGRAP